MLCYGMYLHSSTGQWDEKLTTCKYYLVPSAHLLTNYISIPTDEHIITDLNPVYNLHAKSSKESTSTS